MPFTYEIDADAGFLKLVGTGTITQPERLQTLQAFLRDPSYRPGLDTFCDFSAADSIPTLSELERIVDVMIKQAARIGVKKIAIVAPKPATFGTARQFQLLYAQGPLTVQVFKEPQDAWAWLREPRT